MVHEAGETALDRRTLLRRGAVVGGSLVWATPVVQSLPASAFAAVGSPPPGDPPPGDPPPLVGELPSHGFFLVKRKSDGRVYGYQVGGTGQLGTMGNGNDVRWLANNGWPQNSYIRGDSKNDTRWSEVKATISAGVGSYLDTSVTPAVQRAAYRFGFDSSLKCVEGAWIFDGSFQKDPSGEKIRVAVFHDGAYYFPKI